MKKSRFTLIELLIISILPLTEAAELMDTYPVTVRVKCASSEEAEKANLKILPLPPGKNVAFSFRWDDTNPRHSRMKKLMTKYGYKGTFYLSKPDKKYREKILPELISDGCTIGNHTLSHLYLPLLTPNGMHYEILGARILHERLTDRPENAFGFPYGKVAWRFLPDSEQIISSCLRRAGLLGGPDRAMDQLSRMPGNEFYSNEGKLIFPGDRNTKPEKFDSDVKRHLPQQGETAHLVLGFHVWHSDEDFRNLEEALKKYANRPDWWYCNENEFLAYTRMVRHARVGEKKVEGDTAVFVLDLPCPEDLGSDTPLWAECAGKNIEIRHTRKIPQTIDAVEGAGKSGKFAGLNAQVSLIQPSRVRLSITNSGAALEHVRITLRLPPVFRQETVFLHIPRIDGAYAKEWDLETDPSMSRAGKQLTAAQIDFLRNGIPGRLWVSNIQENPQPAEEMLPVLCSRKHFDEAELKELSRPDSKPDPKDFTPLARPLNFRSCAYRIPWGLKKPMTVIIDFAGNGKMTLKASSLSGRISDTFYCNGEKMTFKDGAAQLPDATGPCRVVMSVMASFVLILE